MTHSLAKNTLKPNPEAKVPFNNTQYVQFRVRRLFLHSSTATYNLNLRGIRKLLA